MFIATNGQAFSLGPDPKLYKIEIESQERIVVLVIDGTPLHRGLALPMFLGYGPYPCQHLSAASATKTSRYRDYHRCDDAVSRESRIANQSIFSYQGTLSSCESINYCQTATANIEHVGLQLSKSDKRIFLIRDQGNSGIPNSGFVERTKRKSKCWSWDAYGFHVPGVIYSTCRPDSAHH